MPAIVLLLVCVVLVAGVNAEGNRYAERDPPINKHTRLLKANDNILIQRFAKLVTDVMSKGDHYRKELSSVKNDMDAKVMNFERNVIARIDDTTEEINTLKQNKENSEMDINILEEKMDNVTKDMNNLKQQINYSATEMKSIKQKMDEDRKTLIDSINASIRDGLNSVKNDMLEEINDLKKRLAGCQPGYTGNAYGCYKVVSTEKVSWETAKTRCENDGAHLVSLGSSEEVQALGALVESQGTGVYSYYWTGGQKKDGQWSWTSDGTEFSHTNWGPHRPFGLWNCVFMLYDPSDNDDHLKWADGICDATESYICET